MKFLELTCGYEDKDTLIAELYEHGTLGVSETDFTPGRFRLQAFFDEQFDTGLFETFAPVWGDAEERDWRQESLDGWQPMEAGKRFYLVPAWRDDAAPEGRIRLTIHPGLAFGTGADTTTQLCLEALEECVKSGDRVFDIGTGTGILAEAAVLLGAGFVIACDTDPDAANTARENTPSAVNVFAGSSRAVASASMDVIVANIITETLGHIAPDMHRILKPGGTLILSGIAKQGAERLDGKFHVRERRERNEWLCLICENL